MSAQQPVASTEEQVILVDTADREIGIGGKLDVHLRGKLHRAFSVIIHDRSGRLLLQRRHTGKYHSGGLWTNACCGHPRPGEEVLAAASRRLGEEMGFSCALEPLGTVHYRAQLDGGMIEHEIAHIVRGQHDGPVEPDPAEADEVDWRTLDDIRAEIAREPERYTAWFRRYVAESWPVAGRQGPLPTS